MNLFLTRGLAILSTVLLPACAIGCGMAASPHPPSLELPQPIHDLAAARIGNRVNLTWNAPSETTDRLKIKAPVQLRICRESNAASCATIATMSTAPGKAANYADILPPALTIGRFHAITYEIFAINKHGRSAGPSNAAAALAGEAPPKIQNFSVTMAERGAVLHWQPVTGLQPEPSIELQRTLLTPEESNGKKSAVLPTAGELIDETLRVPPTADRTPGTALDSSVQYNREYRYVAMRVAELNGLRVASVPSQPVLVYTRDTFPPAVPTGLAAVPVSASMNHGTAEVDLSWSANTEPDFAQYLVYRRDVSVDTTAEQLAPDNSSQPIVAPTFRDLHVQPGDTYAYSVIAVDSAGNKSSRSAEVVVSVPSS